MMGKADERSRLHKRAVIRQCLADGMSPSRIAKETGFSYRYVKMIAEQESDSHKEGKS